MRELVESGFVESEQDLIDNHGTKLTEIFFNWVQRGQLGCVFATKLATKHRNVGWESFVNNGELPPKKSAELITERLDDYASAGIEAVQVILPRHDTEQSVIQLINALCETDRWYWTQIPLKDSSVIAVGLRWILPSTESVNWVLGFADLPSMPLTRRSPFTAMVLRIAEVKRSASDTENGKLVVHLADLDSHAPSEAVHEKWAQGTADLKARLVLDDNLERARAKVTFTLAAGARKDLCDPVSATHAKGQEDA